jgi:hypothetical protein
MGFETIDVVPRMARAITANPDGVSVGIYARKKESPRLTIFIGSNVLAAMGLKLGDRVIVQEGNGADHGIFHISPAGTGRVGITLTARDGSKGGTAKLPSVNMPQVSVDTKRTKTLCNAASVAAEAVTFQRFGSALTIIVPWCHAPVERTDSVRTKESSK